MSTPEQHRPPVYACAAGAVLHAHSADTLEPAVVLYTFLPSGAGDRLDALEAKVDVHGDGPGSSTLTVRVLSDGQSLSWQLPIAPFVAALPGQPGDEGRMVLLAVMDAEPEDGFWAQPVDCERLAAELQLPVTDLVDALRGRLTPWLADDVELLLHDDAHEHAADLSPAETLASAVVAHYKGDLEAEQSSTRLLRAFEYAPKEFQAELGSRLCAALSTAVVVAGPDAVDAVLEQTGPFEPEVTRLLTELRGLPADPFDAEAASEAAAAVVLSSAETGESIKGAVAAIARLARVAFGPDTAADDLLRKLAMASDSTQYRLASMWVELAVAAGGSADTDPVVASELASRIAGEGAVGAEFLKATGAVLGAYALELSGKPGGRMAGALKSVDQLLATRLPAAAPMPVEAGTEGIRGCLALARFIRTRGGIGPGSWRTIPVESAAQAVGLALAGGLDADLAVDLLDELLAEDVQGPDMLEVFVCAIAQLLVEVDPLDSPEVMQTRVTELVSRSDWLMAACLQEAPDHDPAATDVRDYLPRDSRLNVEEADRLALKAGRRGVMARGFACIDAFAAVVGDGIGLTRDELFALVLPGALVEHDVLLSPER